jgi:hypothetical protein
MLLNGVPQAMKGRAVQIEHFLFDNLWESGPRIIPPQIQIVKEDIQEESKEEEK